MHNRSLNPTGEDLHHDVVIGPKNEQVFIAVCHEEAAELLGEVARRPLRNLERVETRRLMKFMATRGTPLILHVLAVARQVDPESLWQLE